MALENKANFAVPLQCQYSAIFNRFYLKMCDIVWKGAIDDELGKSIGDIGIQKNYRRIERGYDFDFFYITQYRNRRMLHQNH